MQTLIDRLFREIVRERKYLTAPNASRKSSAHSAVSRAIKDGTLTRQPCEVCGDIRSVAHHGDYLKPLEVRWLCAAHHADWHTEFGRQRMRGGGV